MSRNRQFITDTELAVLKALWDSGPLTAKAIAEMLYGNCSESELGTVHSMLQRLERKKFILRDRSSHAHVFSSVVSRSEVAGQELQLMAKKLADGSMAPFLTHLVQADRLTEEEINEIRHMLDAAALKRRKKRKTR